MVDCEPLLTCSSADICVLVARQLLPSMTYVCCLPAQVDWELLLLKKLAAMFGQESTSSLLVYDIRRVDGFIRLGWVNDTVSTHRCDKLALAHIASVRPLPPYRRASPRYPCCQVDRCCQVEDHGRCKISAR